MRHNRAPVIRYLAGSTCVLWIKFTFFCDHIQITCSWQT